MFSEVGEQPGRGGSLAKRARRVRDVLGALSVIVVIVGVISFFMLFTDSGGGAFAFIAILYTVVSWAVLEMLSVICSYIALKAEAL